MRILRLFIIAGLMFCAAQTLSAQTKAVKTNSLYWLAGGSMNAGYEQSIGEKGSLQASLGYNPWTFSNNKKLKHISFMPELRYWTKQRFKGHFLATHLFYSHYNVGGIKMPLGFYPSLKENRYQGDIVALGLAYGHSWRLKNPHWAIEAEVGAGLGYAVYDIYECRTCGSKKGNDAKLYVVPTKVALNIVYYLDPEKKKPVAEPFVPIVTPQPEPQPELVSVPEPEPEPEPAPVVLPKAVELRKDNPLLVHISEYRPYDRSMVLRKLKGALYVHFPFDKDDVRYDFRDNAATMEKIIDITRQIMADSLSEVKIIQIVGLASIEGPIQHNETLALNRAEALKKTLQAKVNAPDSLFECVGGGEAWTELRDQIEELSFDGRDELLQIIDTEKDLNRRERKIRQLKGGKPYAYLRTNVLSDQRNSGYVRIYYDNK